jgi:hypothetical protein
VNFVRQSEFFSFFLKDLEKREKNFHNGLLHQIVDREDLLTESFQRMNKPLTKSKSYIKLKIVSITLK